jgi:hypothetical protein
LELKYLVLIPKLQTKKWQNGQKEQNSYSKKRV